MERALGESAVGARHQVLAAEQLAEAHQPLGHQLRVLDDVGSVADHPRHQDFPWRQLDALPDAPLVLVARVGALDEIGAGADFQDQVDDVLQRHVGGMRAGPAAPADVVADFFFRYPLQRGVGDVDLQLEPAAVVLQRRRRHHAIVGHGEARIVQLQQETCIDNGPVLGAHGL